MRKGIVALICFVGIYWLVVAAGTAVAAPPPNDDLANAQVLTGPLPTNVTGTTVGATREDGEPTHEGWVPSGHSVWYRWEAATTEYITVNTCGSEKREMLDVYEGSTYGALKEVASNGYDDGCGYAVHGESSVSFTAVAGHAYSISVDGDGFGIEDPSSVGEGSIELRISRMPPPPNDNFDEASTVTAGEGGFQDGPLFSIDNHGATKQPGEPDHRGDPGGASVWFQWTAPRSGGVAVRGCRESEGSVAVYTGHDVAALTVVPQLVPTDSCDYVFFATAGVTYRIAVDGRTVPATGAPNLISMAYGEVRYIPDNDEFENAAPVADPFTGRMDTNVTIFGYGTIGATKEPGEPNHAGDPGGASVWFEWTAPETGSVEISACNASFSPLLAVYTGEELDHLTPVDSAIGSPGEGCPDDANADPQVAFNVHEGITYNIAVDGVGGATGKFEFGLRASDQRLRPPAQKAPAPAPPAPSGATPIGAKPSHMKTKITGRHIDRVRGIAIFDLAVNPKESSAFRCKLDKRKFAKCGAKVTYRHLGFGPHTFVAEAVGATGAADATPVRAKFRIAPIPR